MALQPWHSSKRTWSCALVLVSVLLAGSVCAVRVSGAELGATAQRRLLQLADAPLVRRPQPHLFVDSPRTIINDPTGYENALGLIYNEGGACSGALISPSAVLTAAHCFFDSNASTPSSPKVVKFYPGYTFNAQGRVKSLYGEAGGLGSGVNVTDVFIHPVFQALVANGSNPSDGISNAMAAVDLAVLTLDRNVINASDAFGVATSCQVRQDANGFVARLNDVAIAGYPKDAKPFGTLLKSTCGIPIYHDDNCTDGVLYNQCSLLQGNSGGPVFVEYQEEGRKRPYVFAVVSYQNYIPDECNSRGDAAPILDTLACYNAAAEIDEQKKQLIVQWTQGLQA